MPAALRGRADVSLGWVSWSTYHEGKEADYEDDDDDQAAAVRSTAIDTSLPLIP